VYAVIDTGGKQVRVQEGGTVRVERLHAAPGDEVTLDRILLVGGTDKTEIGAPAVAGALVRARVLRQGRGRKIRVMKYKSKAHYRRRSGHRQAFTELRIEKIEFAAEAGERPVEKSADAEKPAAARTPARPRRKKTGGE